MQIRQSENSLLPLGLSLGAHLLLLGLLAANLSLWPRQASQPVRLAIDAAVVPDLEAVRQREAEQRRRRETEERRRAEEARRQREALEQQRRAEEQRRLAAERQRLEQQRRAAAEAERRARAQRQREAEQRRRREAEERRRAAEARQRQAEREAELQAQLAAEQAREDAIRGGLLAQWIEVIRQKVQRNWIKPPSAGPGLECELRVRQIPGGDVVGVEIGRCNGDAAVVRSIENAVYRAAPLPPPPDPALFERNIVLIFRPEE
ncbi:MAG: hypothetical protein D6727_07840 [Gammaproteobacteria bacterium]|nr:MAG: hypothetical protein D6727_07840 [Gammaproteobacteria bacterium]